MNENNENNFAGDASNESNLPVQPTTDGNVSKDMLVKIGAGVLSLVVVLGLVFFVLGNKGDSRFTDAVASCGLIESSGITLAEDGNSLVFDGKGEDDYTGGNVFDVECLLTAMEAPSTVWARMLKTSSSDGQQEADWDGISVQWSYHPDVSLDANFDFIG